MILKKWSGEKTLWSFIYSSSHSGRMRHKVVFNVGCLCVYIKAQDKNCPVHKTTVMLMLVFHQPSLSGAMREVMPQSWNPQNQTSLKAFPWTEHGREVKNGYYVLLLAQWSGKGNLILISSSAKKKVLFPKICPFEEKAPMWLLPWICQSSPLQINRQSLSVLLSLESSLSATYSYLYHTFHLLSF